MSPIDLLGQYEKLLMMAYAKDLKHPMISRIKAKVKNYRMVVRGPVGWLA